MPSIMLLRLPILLLILQNNINCIFSRTDFDYMGDDWNNDIPESLLCHLSKETTNVYGSETEYSQIIKYYYSMEYGVDDDNDDVDDLIYDIEIGIGNTILISSHLFDECHVYNQEGRGRRHYTRRLKNILQKEFEQNHRRQSYRRRLLNEREDLPLKIGRSKPRSSGSSSSGSRKLNEDVVGMSTNPTDTYISQECSSNSSSSRSQSECVLVQGQMTLYFENNSSILKEDEVNDIKALIEGLMGEFGALKQTYSNIYELEYHESKPDPKKNQSNNGDDDGSVVIGGGGGKVLRSLLISGSVIVVGVLGFVGYRKWKERRQ